MIAEATANLRGARAAAPVAPVSPANLAELRYQRAVMLADLRVACQWAWRPDVTCDDALALEVESWSDELDATIGELGFVEITALWHSWWNEMSAAAASDAAPI